MTTIAEERDAFAERLRELGADIRFTGGQPSVPHADGGLAVLVDRDRRASAGALHRVTVCAGLPPPPEVAGLLCTLRKAEGGALVRRAITDRMGRARLDGLEPAEYRLCVEPPVTFPLPPEVSARIHSHLAGKAGVAGVDRLLLEFETGDGRVRAALDEAAGGPGGLLLRLDLDAETTDCLPRFDLGGKGRVLASGFVGVRPGLGGRLFGEVRLDLCSGLIRDELEGWEEIPEWPTHPTEKGIPDSLRLTIRRVPEASLARGDRDSLQRSLRATNDPRSRAVLEELIKKVSAVP